MWACDACGMQVCFVYERSATDGCAGFHETRRSGDPPSNSMEVDATWLDTSTYFDTLRDTQIEQEPAIRSDEQRRQMSQEGTTTDIREEYEEVRREVFRPQQPFRWPATTEVEALTEQTSRTHAAMGSRERRRSESGESSRRTSEMRSQPRNRHLEVMDSGRPSALWATPQTLLRTPLSTGEGEANPSNKQNQYRAGGCREI